MSKYELIYGDNIAHLKKIQDKSIDAVICDPPYACVKREYGYWTEEEWQSMMDSTIIELRRVLKPKGSAMFVLQANQTKIGQTSTWLFKFLAKYSEEWNMVQDAYCWNYSYMPTTHVSRKNKLMRPSVKFLAWFGAPDCYRNQDAILWEPSVANKAHKLSDRALKKYPSGSSMREGRCIATTNARGGSTPFNVLPLKSDESGDNMLLATGGKKAGSRHGATTSYKLCEYWVNYICPPNGTILDPWSGTGTVGVAAIAHKRNYIGIEKLKAYHDEAEVNLKQISRQMESICDTEE